MPFNPTGHRHTFCVLFVVASTYWEDRPRRGQNKNLVQVSDNVLLLLPTFGQQISVLCTDYIRKTCLLLLSFKDAKSAQSNSLKIIVAGWLKWSYLNDAVVIF